MQSERTYLRRAPAQAEPRFLTWLLGILCGVFLFQKVLGVWFSSDFLMEYGALSGARIRAGYAWTILTHALLHGSPLHLLVNVFGLFFIGRHLQESIGQVRLVWLSLLGALSAGLLWLGIHFAHPGNVIGASGLGMAYLTVFVCLDPQRPLAPLFTSFTFRLWGLLAALVAVDLAGLFWVELPRRESFFRIAHSAHLGGVLMGWLFHRVVLAPRGQRSAPAIEPPAWARQRSPQANLAYTVNVEPLERARPVAAAGKAVASRPIPAVLTPAERRASIRVEVDRILDKINQQGFDALTTEEKRTLDEARSHLGTRSTAR